MTQTKMPLGYLWIGERKINNIPISTPSPLELSINIDGIYYLAVSKKKLYIDVVPLSKFSKILDLDNEYYLT